MYAFFSVVFTIQAFQLPHSAPDTGGREDGREMEGEGGERGREREERERGEQSKALQSSHA